MVQSQRTKGEKKPMSDSQYDFPREDLGENERFKFTSGSVKTDDSTEMTFCGGRHTYIRVADAYPGSKRLPTFMCLLCQRWGIIDKDIHVCERGLGIEENA